MPAPGTSPRCTPGTSTPVSSTARWLAKGAHGYLSKTLPVRELVGAIESIAAGEIVSEPPPRSRPPPPVDWPGRTEGLTDRQAEVLAFITQGKSNAEIAAVMYLSINTVKSYIRTTAYRKVGVTDRSHALLCGVDHGFSPDRNRIDHWHGGPLPRLGRGLAGPRGSATGRSRRLRRRFLGCRAATRRRCHELLAPSCRRRSAATRAARAAACRCNGATVSRSRSAVNLRATWDLSQPTSDEIALISIATCRRTTSASSSTGTLASDCTLRPPRVGIEQ